MGIISCKLSYVERAACICRKRLPEFCYKLGIEVANLSRLYIKVANEVGRKWGCTPFVTFEVSAAGHHKNSYSTRVPVIDYASLGYKVTAEYAVEHIKKHGGVFSYNHPFTEWKNAHLSDKEKERVVDECIDDFTETRLLGAKIMEVGFPYPKEDFHTQHYLRLWDGLSLRGFFITGDGDSDNHHAVEDGWLFGNNFATWVGISDGLLPTEENIV